MGNKGIFRIGFGAVFAAVTGFAMSFLLMLAVFYFDAPGGKGVVPQIAAILFSGVPFVLISIIVEIIHRDIMRSTVKFFMLLGTMIYMVLVIFLLPRTLDLNLVYRLMPGREMAGGIFVFMEQAISCATASIYGIVCLVMLMISRRKIAV